MTRKNRKSETLLTIAMLVLMASFLGLLLSACRVQENNDTRPNSDCVYTLVQFTELKSPNGPNYYTYEYECRECGHRYTLEKKVEK